MDSDQPQIKDIAFNFTGFGPFLSIETNPTSVLIQSIKTWTDKGELNFNVSDARVLTVAAQDCREYVSEIVASIEEKQKASPGIKQILVHMGVDDGAEQICFELHGYNTADFGGGPDVKGYCPENEKINGDLPLEHDFRTVLPIEAIHSALQAKHKVALSVDPGRYICNYMYYLSLTNGEKKGIPSLFIHVPAFSQIDKENQEAFLKDFMKVTREALLKGGNKENNKQDKDEKPEKPEKSQESQ